MKKLAALAAVFFLLAGIFAGCADETAAPANETASVSTAEPETEADTEPGEIAGLWTYTLDLDRLFTASRQDTDADDDRVHLLTDLYSGLSVTVIMELREDGTFTKCVEEASVDEAARQLEVKLTYELPDLIVGLNGMMPEEYEAQLAEEGTTLDEIVAEYREQLNAEGIFESMRETETGSYSYDDGWLNLTSDAAGSVLCSVELRSKELRITGIESETNDPPESLLPVVFVRSDG